MDWLHKILRIRLIALASLGHVPHLHVPSHALAIISMSILGSKMWQENKKEQEVVEI